MTRLQSVQAYWRRLPDRIGTLPHIELQRAYEFDKATKDLAEDIAAVIDRDLQQEQRA
ncbi:hypothetical protein LB579_34140 [Mesorhizobium sp. BR1-1-7]|uniref:hypothetical protein n=1 Tax=Mesorhizobium sp. BR1-1-7 TaxID=2876647 RepID=UPI001CCB9EC8|nr:hypothetical protein [Mesorhizobium sp. BR1-1-7]MBZ9922700.1 hypothetical protein [Mesorhizobium sp. BR1-1-7]